MKEHIVSPAHWDGETVVQFTESEEVTKKLLMSVPNQYRAVVYIDEKLSFRAEPCERKPVLELCGKDYLGKKLQAAYVFKANLPQMAWGFGNIQVNNDRLREAYRVGANGKLTVSVSDYAKLIAAFPFGENISAEQIRQKVLSEIKTVGVPILASYFSNTSISVFEISSLVGEIREKLKAALAADPAFSGMGISAESVTVDGIHVNEDDLEVIRCRMNG